MRSSRGEAGFTLVELLVVAAIVVVIIATVGTFFLGGTTPAVASAATDIANAFDEGRETAIAMSESTIVFAAAGNGYSARVYRGMPGNTQFAPVNGPTYDSTVSITETAAPLGAPTFALRIDGRGSVTGYKAFDPNTGTGTVVDCPPSGHFILKLAYERETRTIPVPCTLSLSMLAPAIQLTPPPAATTNPATPGPCPNVSQCQASLPPFTATCPPGYTPDGTQPYVCDSPTPVPTPTSTPTCPPGEVGSFPNCMPGTVPTPTPPPTSAPPHAVALYGIEAQALEMQGIGGCLGNPCRVDASGYLELLSNGDVLLEEQLFPHSDPADVDPGSLCSNGYTLVNSGATDSLSFDPGSTWPEGVSQSGTVWEYDPVYTATNQPDENGGFGAFGNCPLTGIVPGVDCTQFPSHDSYAIDASTDLFALINGDYSILTDGDAQGYVQNWRYMVCN